MELRLSLLMQGGVWIHRPVLDAALGPGRRVRGHPLQLVVETLHQVVCFGHEGEGLEAHALEHHSLSRLVVSLRNDPKHVHAAVIPDGGLVHSNLDKLGVGLHDGGREETREIHGGGEEQVTSNHVHALEALEGRLLGCSEGCRCRSAGSLRRQGGGAQHRRRTCPCTQTAASNADGRQRVRRGPFGVQALRRLDRRAQLRGTGVALGSLCEFGARRRGAGARCGCREFVPRLQGHKLGSDADLLAPAPGIVNR
mmetsp:Transcript_17510/g.66209  ORF Transcript_17510/g.66209 Transcript_17510/m.66209 type:complete len:254 (+) Transcript_17510:141-902(+)